MSASARERERREEKTPKHKSTKRIVLLRGETKTNLIKRLRAHVNGIHIEIHQHMLIN